MSVIPVRGFPPRALPLLIGSLLPFLSGCASVEAGRSVRTVAETAGSRGGVKPVFLSDAEAERHGRDETDRLLAEPVTAERAVRIALLNNPELQSRLAGLGVARSDWVRAGLPPGPLAGGYRLHSATPGLSAGWGLTLSFDLLDFLFWPRRRRIARAELRAAELRAADAVLALESETRTAWSDYATALSERETLASLDDNFAAGSEVARRQLEAGAAGTLFALAQKAAADDSHAARLRLDPEVAAKGERLLKLMGVADRAGKVTVEAGLPDLPDHSGDELSGAEQAAIERRLDLAAARESLTARGRALGLARLESWLTGGDLGYSWQRETDGERKRGPEASVRLPGADLGRGLRGRAKAEWLSALRDYQAREQSVRGEVRTAHARLHGARLRADYCEATLRPDREALLRETLRHYNGMLRGVFDLLEAKRGVWQARLECLEARRDYWTARSELNRATGGAVAFAVPATGSATSPGGTP